MSDRTNDVKRHDGLSYVMEFDHVIEVTEDGRVIDGPDNIYAPDLYDEELDNDDWEFFSTGYTGQYGYNGPIMHNSELLSGRLEHDIRSTPGIYAAVAAYWTIDENDEDAEFVDNPYIEGWAVVKLKGL